MTKPTGRARGRPKGAVSTAKRELAEMAKEHAGMALQTLVGIAMNGESEGSRVSAAIAILDRGYGKPFQAVHHAGHDGGELPSLDPTRLSVAAMRELLDAIDDEAPDPNESGPDSD